MSLGLEEVITITIYTSCILSFLLFLFFFYFIWIAEVVVHYRLFATKHVGFSIFFEFKIFGDIFQYFVSTLIINCCWLLFTFQLKKGARLLEVMVVGIMTAVITFGVSASFSCEPLSDITYYPNVCDNTQGNDNETQPATTFCEVTIR